MRNDPAGSSSEYLDAGHSLGLLLDQLLRHEEQDVLFRGHVHVQACKIEGAGARDVANGRLVKSALKKQAGGNIDDLAAPLRDQFLILDRGWNLSGHLLVVPLSIDVDFGRRKAASPKSTSPGLTMNALGWGYGFRATSLRSVPGMTEAHYACTAFSSFASRSALSLARYALWSGAAVIRQARYGIP